jgi:uncharacterized protein YjbI with pentapeptide repeats
MLRKLRPHLSFANVTSVLALFVALGGTSAYAVNEWNGSNIQDETLTGADVKNSTLTGQDIFDNTISGKDITNGSLTGADVFDNTLGGADITNGSISGSDVAYETLGGVHIQNGTVSTFDIGDEGIGPDDIADGSLNDEDISENTFVNFVATIGTVPAHACVDRTITGIAAAGDHLLLTQNWASSADNLIYSIQYQDPEVETAELKACNLTANAIDDGNTRFNLLVFDAQ